MVIVRIELRMNKVLIFVFPQDLGVFCLLLFLCWTCMYGSADGV